MSKTKLRTLRKQRTFKLLVELQPYSAYAWDVINSIEQKTIRVVDPYDENALRLDEDSSGAIVLDSNEKLEVPIFYWLSLGCQRIRWEEPNEGVIPVGKCGMYKNNLFNVFGFPFGESTPHGISTFIGEIILPLEIRHAIMDSKASDDRDRLSRILQFIIAHELVHVFDYLKFLVPAFMNWRAFLKNVLQDGSNLDELSQQLCDKSLFIDSYGEGNELLSIKEWWPSMADCWFKCRNDDWSNLAKKNGN